ncbi:MAG: Rne/Rng family ribonuclease [Rickettsiales bacterium]|nr:Rne/Rng family ribonuclease [Rickettsiales bacterium]
MSKKILIDGAFKEETRVALLSNGVLEDYDREDFNFKQLKGNIYLAKITRVEPSLQAAFVEYGGERHGFLPFSDIHPDYYNIPKEEIKDLKKIKFFQNGELNNPVKIENAENSSETLQTTVNSEIKVDNVEVENHIDDNVNKDINEEKDNLGEPIKFSTEDENNNIEIPNYPVDEEADVNSGNNEYSQYKIEDVIKEGQFVLVQVLKEERGNKGVAMTTYISIAGKYCVLMVNSPERGGVSKKVNNINDRKILKSILRSLNVPNDKSIILRTAGVGKKPEEILKDYLYLARLWDAIKNTAFESKAFTFIHAEDDIIKRTIRDLYSDDVEEIVVEGEEVFKSVKSLLKIIAVDKIPNLRLHNDKTPLFQRHAVENQLLELYNNKVNLPSGGSIVLDQTEALVAIDVNSAKAIKEKGIEEMATATNIEAAKEIARQLKLRDLAGLVVIDFIDMFEIKNRRLVEKAIRDSMMDDRARIQIARLSIFGLMELSRQRLGASFMERSSEMCPRCKGKGKIRAKEIVAMSILRAIKYATLDKQINIITVETTPELSSYLLNFKRKNISQIEKEYNIFIFIEENPLIEDNEYNLKKRKGLTPDEKKELDPQEKTGKVNSNFNDNNLHSVNNNEIKKYKFDDETYGNNDRNSLKRVNNKKHFNKYNKVNNNNNNSINSTNKKTNWFKKLLGVR